MAPDNLGVSDYHARRSSGRLLPLLPHPPGDQQGHLQRLLVVQPRIDVAAIRLAEIGLAQSAGPADALRDVLAGQLEMDAAENRAQPLVNFKGLIQFARGCRRSRGSSRRWKSATCCRASGRSTRARSCRGGGWPRPAAAEHSSIRPTPKRWINVSRPGSFCGIENVRPGRASSSES